MDSYKSDIVIPPIKNMFEDLFRKNIIAVILLVIIANGYSNIPGMNNLLTYLFNNHLIRFIITFILFFQIIDNIKESLIWSIVINIILYIIEYNHLRNKKNHNK
jgi:hypothetical protein